MEKTQVIELFTLIAVASLLVCCMLKCIFGNNKKERVHDHSSGPKHDPVLNVLN